MSIATLKKKTQAKYNNLSVSQSQFSINGTLRNQGYIGQTSLSRSFVHTPMLGNTVKGYGGLNGSYKQNPVILETSIFTTNDPKIVKQSVGNHSGDIAVQNKYLTCREFPCSNPVVKNLEYSSNSYTEELRKKTLKCEINNNIVNNIYGDNLVKNGNMDTPDILLTAITVNAIPTSWNVVGTTNTYGMVDLALGSGTWTKNGLPSTILQFFFIQTDNTVNTSISQTIQFPSSGNYVLSFWYFNASKIINSTMTASVGSITSKTYGNTDGSNTQWFQSQIPFTVNETQLSQSVKFSMNLFSGAYFFYITGVSIYSIDAPCCKLSDSGLPSSMFSKKVNSTTKVLTNNNGSIKYNGSYSDYLARLDNSCNKKTNLIVNTNRGPIF